jgi:hypothetical protein
MAKARVAPKRSKKAMSTSEVAPWILSGRKSLPARPREPDRIQRRCRADR